MDIIIATLVSLLVYIHTCGSQRTGLSVQWYPTVRDDRDNGTNSSDEINLNRVN